MKKIIVTIILASFTFAAIAQTQTLERLFAVEPGATLEYQYGGCVSISKNAASSQYINLSRYGGNKWSLGTVYNSNTFAIGLSTYPESSFTSPFFTIKPTGEVGIGTTSPATLLNVVGTTDLSPTTHGLMVFGATNTTNIGIDQNEIMARNNGVASSLYLNHEGGNIIFNGMNIAGGNIGLGTSAPGSKFDIVGAYNNLSLRVTNDTYNDWVLQKRRSDNTQLFGIKESGSNGSMSFLTNNTERVTVASEGNVGIGILTPQYLLDVAGTIRAKEVIVTVSGFPDFVFEKAYSLPKLHDVNDFIQSNGHLPNIPSAKEVEKNGMSMADLQVKLLQKVEELTLYAIEQQKQISEQQKRIGLLENALKDNK